MKIKQTVIKSFTAAVCVIVLCASGVSGMEKVCDAIRKTAELSAGGRASVSDSGDEAVQDSGFADKNSIVDENAAAAGADAASAPDTVETEGAVTGSGAKEEKTAVNNQNEKSNGGSQQTAPSTPSTPAETVSLFNTAVTKAVSSKVGFRKIRITDNEVVDANNMEKLKMFEEKVYKFMGIGEANMVNKTVEKGKWDKIALLSAGRLSAADVKSASCTKSGENYDIVITLQNGSGSASESNPVTQPSTALDKCGICVGTSDKREYDHKSASVIYDAIQGTLNNAKVSESYSNAVVKAKVNASTGRLVSLRIDWSIKINMEAFLWMLPIEVKATGDSHVTYSDFKY